MVIVIFFNGYLDGHSYDSPWFLAGFNRETLRWSTGRCRTILMASGSTMLGRETRVGWSERFGPVKLGEDTSFCQLWFQGDVYIGDVKCWLNGDANGVLMVLNGIYLGTIHGV